MEYGRKRRTAYRSGRREMAGLESLLKWVRPDGKKTDRTVSSRQSRKAKIGGSGVDRTPFKHKRWKRA